MAAEAVTTPDSCLHCGFQDPGPLECPRCGVVLAKARPARAGAAPLIGERTSEPRRFTWVDAVLVAGLAASGAVIWFRPPEAVRTVSRSVSQPPGFAPAPAPVTAGAQTTGVLVPDVAIRLSREPVPPPPAAALPRPGNSGLPLADERALVRLSNTAARRAVEDSDVREAEELHSRYPQMPNVDPIVESVLVGAAMQAQGSGRLADAGRLFTRATELLPNSPSAWVQLIQFFSTARDWREMELAARRGISARPADGNIHRALALALTRQNRSEDAADVLRRALAQKDEGETRSQLREIERELESGRGMARRSSSHFSVQFEGEKDDALGSALVRMLEDKYSMLGHIFGYEPEVEIPVILYPMQTFRGVTSAPGWAGASYSHFDGWIRIGTRGLSPSFVPLDMERTITHEMVHAFVDGLTHGNAPRDINEGLAQYHSGQRLGYRLARDRVSSMKVDDFYDAALSFVEYLLDKYRQSAMNELLTLMGKVSVDEAFRRAYGQHYRATREEWIKQLD